VVKNNPNKRNLRFLQVIIVLTVTSTLLKLTLIGPGLFANMDEGKYREAEEVFIGIKKGDMTHAMTHLFSTEPPQARPGYTLVMTILESAYHGLRHVRDFTHSRFNIEYGNVSRGYLIFVFNYITLVCILFLLWRLSYGLSSSQIVAWLTVLIFVSTLYSSLYLRHALPYNLALLINLIIANTLFFRVSGSRNLTLILAGALAGVSFTIYPGYILLSSVIFLSYYIYKRQLLTACTHACISAVGFLLVIGTTESIALYTTGISYLLDSKSLSATITQGNPQENLSFIGIYILNSGVILDILLTLLIALAIIQIPVQLWKKQNLNRIQLLGIAILIVLVGYGSIGMITGSLVYYGRLIYQFLPLLILFGCSSIITSWDNTSSFKAATFFISLMLICSYSTFISLTELNQIGYSNDFIQEMLPLAKEEGRAIYYTYETKPIYTTKPTIPIDSIELLESPSLVIVNASFFYRRSWEGVETGNIKSELPHLDFIATRKHYQNSMGYLMENNSSEFRDFITSWNPQLYAIRVN